MQDTFSFTYPPHHNGAKVSVFNKELSMVAKQHDVSMIDEFAAVNHSFLQSNIILKQVNR